MLLLCCQHPSPHLWFIKPYWHSSSTPTPPMLFVSQRGDQTTRPETGLTMVSPDIERHLQRVVQRWFQSDQCQGQMVLPIRRQTTIWALLSVKRPLYLLAVKHKEYNCIWKTKTWFPLGEVPCAHWPLWDLTSQDADDALLRKPVTKLGRVHSAEERKSKATWEMWPQNPEALSACLLFSVSWW